MSARPECQEQSGPTRRESIGPAVSIKASTEAPEISHRLASVSCWKAGLLARRWEVGCETRCCRERQMVQVATLVRDIRLAALIDVDYEADFLTLSDH